MTDGTSRVSFGARLHGAVRARGNLCVGIDPHPALLDAWGLGVNAVGVREFSRRSLEAFGDLVPAIKPQVAFFEEHGSGGFAVLEEVLASIVEAGALSIADAKRGDIGSTMAGYARAWLAEGSPLACDALTVSPYLGVASLDAAFDAATANDRGLFVLARTSNPEAVGLQAATGPSGTVAQMVVDEVGHRNAASGPGAPGSFGVVVGATVAEPPRLDDLSGPVLMPGVGEQGGTAEDVRRIAGPALPRTLVNVSRHVLRSGPDVGAMRAVVRDLAETYRFAESD
ncbi:orotidine-5'-phosphate decarboxylase [Dietzia sp. SYD-A1]|uniref:orotidine-5'-phosphate decarboxylase n=1 Tax=Dietzia sp. SYD-A1 TaxID=2780141 RepID=UPI0018910808|nr:orotidine-5'-phosphate decarboxylase [Dietzia sp. SYD-A1]